MSALWRLRMLRWSYALFIAAASAQTFLNPQAHGHTGVGIRILAGFEFLAAVAFLFGVFDLPACAVLVIVYAIATAITIASGQSPLRFVFYATTAIFITLQEHVMAPQSSHPQKDLSDVAA